MAATPPSPRALVDSLRDSLYPPRPGEELDYAALLHGLSDARLLSSTAGEDATALAEAAVHFCNLCVAKRGDAALRAALHGLLLLGRPGWRHLLRLLQRQAVPPETCAALLEALPPSCGLGLLQELFHCPALPDKTLLTWAEPLLEALSQADPPEVLRFLLQLDASGDLAAHPLCEALLAGPLGEWIRSRLAAPLNAEIADSLCLCARVLSRGELAADLLRRMAEGRTPPEPRLLSRIAEAAPPGNATAIRALQQLLRSASPDLALVCIAGLARLRWNGTGRTAALLQTRSPALARALPLLAARFPESTAHEYLTALSGQARTDACNAILRASARLQPVFAAAVLKAAPASAGHRQVQRRFATEKKAALTGLRLRKVPTPRDAPLHAEEDKGFFSRLRSNRSASLPELLEQTRQLRDKALPGSELRDTALTGRQFARLDLGGSLFHRVQFIRSHFSGVDFSDATLRETDFTGCSFSNCRFRRTQLHKTALLSCEFSRCDFSGTLFDALVAEDCDVDRSFLTNCLLREARIERTRMRDCALGRCQFQKGESRSLLFLSTSLTANDWIQTRCRGLLWRSCCLRGETFCNVRFSSSEAVSSSAVDCRVLGRATGVGLLDAQEAAREDLSCETLAAEALTAPAPDSPPLPGLEAAPAGQGAARWLRHRETALREARMRRNNQIRLHWAETNMRGPQFLVLLPHLLSSRIFEQAQNLRDVPACRIAGYTPSLEALELAEQHFPGRRDAAPKGKALVIETLATIGSVGSVAQTRDSDADFWVCYDAATASDRDVAGLRAKLDALERWADETFELEAHFFLMSLESVRDNDFGFSGKESSGTAQALMLKEEFYRTALIVAGRIPGWWLTPPGATEAACRAHLRAATVDPLADPERFMDAGHVSRIPPEEFFGAALWQIVKSIDSPFKSVLKLGLLEKYARDHAQGLLLCDRIKRSATRGADATRRTDPYTAMSAVVRNHYLATGDPEAVRLITESLALKADVDDLPSLLGRPCTAEHKALLALLYGEDAPPAATHSDGRSFARALALGADVSRFMIGAYKRIRAAPQEGSAAIAPEDITRLGRRIAAIFSQRKNKVRRVPILGMGRGSFAELHFSADKNPGKATRWLVHGKTGKRGVASTRKNELLTGAADPARLLAWLVANGIYAPSALVDAETSIAPLATPDIRNILDGLGEFLPPGKVFHVDPEKYLRDERITRAYLLPNLLAAPDMDKLATLSVIYCTNWGELFCATAPSPAAALKLGAQAYLKKILPQPQPEPPEIKVYYPKRSQCPRIKLA